MKLLQSNLLQNVSVISHGFFCPGDSKGCHYNFSFKNGEKEDVLDARRQACELIFSRYDHLTHVYQEHGSTIWTAAPEHRGAGALDGQQQIGKGDALITNEPSIPLAILIADCLPIFFAGCSGKAVGIAHAGWRGTHQGIASKMVKRFQDEFKIDPAHLLVWIGPGISHCCFKVGKEVWNPIQNKWGDFMDCFDEQSMHIDLKMLNRYQLVMAGVLKENIEDSPDCTCCQNNFFSYRRDGAGAGHNLAVIQRKK